MLRVTQDDVLNPFQNVLLQTLNLVVPRYLVDSSTPAAQIAPVTLAKLRRVSDCFTLSFHILRRPISSSSRFP